MRLVLFILSIFCCCLSIAQENNMNFITFTGQNGLSSDNVNAILKDRYGYMWFATDDGLNKFDGNSFTVYRHDAKDSLSIGSNVVQALYEDSKGNLWVGTSGSPVSIYDRKKDCFKRVGDDHPVVRTIGEDAAGRIWIGGFRGIRVFNPATRKFQQLQLPYNNNPSVGTLTVTALLKDKNDHMWIGSNYGLYNYQPTSKKIVRYLPEKNNSNSLVDHRIRAICEDQKGNLCIGTINGLSVFNKRLNTFTNYSYNSDDKNSISNNSIYAAHLAPNGKIWLGTERGLNILDPDNGKIQRVEKDGRNRYSLISRTVKSIFIDKRGIYWIGTYQGGVSKYDENLAFFNLRQSNPYDPFGLKSPIITSFIEENHQKIYVGTDGGGVSLFDRNTGLFHHINLPVGRNSEDLSVLSMERIKDEIWIGCFSQGLYALNTKTGNVTHFDKTPNGLSNNEVFCLRKDARDNLWIGTNGGGVDVYNVKTKHFKNLHSGTGSEPRLPINNFIRAIEIDPNGDVWIGSTSGVGVYKPSDGSWRALKEDRGNLSSNKVSSILITQNGNVWVGTFDGLNYYDKQKDRFINYSEKEGLANSLIYKVLEDNYGIIWVSTNKGISSIDPLRKKIKNYNYDNGVSRRAFVSGSGLKLSNGDLFFGGTDGFNFTNPQKLFSNKNVPNVVFTDLKISNRSISPSENAAIDEHISVAKEIHIDYKQNFSISFATLSFTSPRESRYSYRLKGFDKNWNNVGTLKTAVYTNLYPGKYVFEVKAESEAGEWVTQPKSILIYVNPPFWLTIYAYIFYVLLAGGFLFYLRWRGTQKLKQKFALEKERMKVQQTIEEERKEAERIHSFDQLRIKFLTNLSHEFRTPISLIMGPIEKVMQRTTDEQTLDELGMVKRNARRLLNLVNQLLDFRRLEEHELRLNLSEVDFISFVRDVSEAFRDLSERKKINFEFRSSVAQYYTRFDIDKMERILFNLLSNAFKFTLVNGAISLTIDKPNEGRGGILVTIADTGIGIEEESVNRIFDRFFQSNASPAVINQGTGIGLSITRELVNLHDGTVSVESRVGQGTSFSLYFPFDVIEVEPSSNKSEALDNVNEQEVEVEVITEMKFDVDLPIVLLIEDNEDFRSYLKENLRSIYRIVEAADGKEGWQKVLSSHPEIVVSDISMPFMSGVELCHKIKTDKRTEHIPVILLTALTGEDQQLRGLETGANDFMTKPFNFDILNVKIKNLLMLNSRLKNTYSKRVSLHEPQVKLESGNERMLNKIVKYIEANLSKPNLSVEDLSRHLGMSRGSLYTKIIELTGETPVEYIRTVKLGKAIALMESKDLNISEIAYNSGFTSSNYFARTFRAKYNMSPRDYINQNMKHRQSEN